MRKIKNKLISHDDVIVNVVGKTLLKSVFRKMRDNYLVYAIFLQIEKENICSQPLNLYS